jgi:hypothetical protein
MRARTAGDGALSPRALNRATLARQMLLRREPLTAVAGVERLVALQAQLPRPPFIGLWSRLAGFRREDLIGAVQRREIVRGTMMRATLHLLSRKDYVALRPVLQPSLSRVAAAALGKRAQGIDVDALVAAARECLAERPRGFAELRTHFGRRFPKVDERAMGYLVRLRLPLLQMAADGAPWAYPAVTDFAVADSWLDAKIKEDAPPDGLALRYFAAFGPASAQDLQTWTGLGAASAVVERLRPRLRAFRDPRGRELFDVPNGPMPPEGTEAPVRFLPEFDNVLLGYADRTRIIADEHRKRIFTRNLLVPATFLLDGFVAGMWSVERKKGTARLLVKPFATLSKASRDALEKEGDELLRFVEPDAGARSVAIVPARA